MHPRILAAADHFRRWLAENDDLFDGFEYAVSAWLTDGDGLTQVGEDYGTLVEVVLRLLSELAAYPDEQFYWRTENDDVPGPFDGQARTRQFLPMATVESGRCGDVDAWSFMSVQGFVLLKASQSIAHLRPASQ